MSMLSLLNRKAVVQRALLRAAADSDSDDEISSRASKQKSDQIQSTNERISFDISKQTPASEPPVDDDSDEDDEFGGDLYGYGRAKGKHDSDEEPEDLTQVDRDHEVIRFDQNMFQATVPLYTYKPSLEDSDSDNDTVPRRSRPSWRIVDKDNNHVDANAIPDDNVEEDIEEDEDYLDEDEEEDEDVYDEDEYEEYEEKVETSAPDASQSDALKREEILAMVYDLEMKELRTRLLSHPEGTSKKKVKDAGAKKERPPSRVQTSLHLLQRLQQPRPVVDADDQFLLGLYSVLLTRSSIEKAQSAPYINYQEPVSKASMLLVCVEKGYLDVLRLMNAIHPHRIKLHLTDRDGNSALHIAAQRGDLPVVKFLIEELNHPYATHAESGWTPLMCAASMGHWHVVEFFLYDWNYSKMKYYEKNKDKFTAKKAEWERHHAAVRAHARAMQQQQQQQEEEEQGEGTAAVDAEGENVEFLPFSGEPSPSIYEYNRRYETPLILAASNGFLNVVQIIMHHSFFNPPPLDAHGRTKVRFNDGMNTLVKLDERKAKRHRGHAHKATDGLRYEHVQFIDHCNVDGLSAVMCAMRYGQLLCVEYLLKQGAKENFPSVYAPPRNKPKAKNRRRRRRRDSQSNMDEESMSRQSHLSRTGHSGHSGHSEDGSMYPSMTSGAPDSEISGRDGDDESMSVSKYHGDVSHFSQDPSHQSSHDRSTFSHARHARGDKSGEDHDFSHMSLKSTGHSAHSVSHMSGMSRTGGSTELLDNDLLYSRLPLIEKIALMTIATKKGDVTSEHAETAISRGRDQWRHHAGDRTFAELVVESDFNIPDRHLVEDGQIGFHLAFHIAKLDSLSGYYLREAEDKGQLRSCVVLLETYQRYWRALYDFPNVTEQLLQDLSLDYKFEFIRIREHIQATRRDSAMCRQRLQEAKRHERLAQLLMQTTSAHKMVNVWDSVLKRYQVAKRLNPQSQRYHAAMQYVQTGLDRCRNENKKM